MIYHKIYHFGDFFMPKNNMHLKSQQSVIERQKKDSRKNPAVILGISFIFAVAVFFASVFFVSFLLEKSPDPNALVAAGSILCTVISCAVGGAVAAKLSGKVLPFSVLSGLLMVVFYLCVSVFFDSAEFEKSLASKTATIIILLVVSFLSGCFFVRKKSRKSKR